MQIQVHYQGLDHTPWMDQFITQRVAKLERFLNQSATVQVHLKSEGKLFQTTLQIHHGHKDYAYSAEGENLYESFSVAIEKGNRALAEQKKRIKDKVHSKQFLIHRDLMKAS